MTVTPHGRLAAPFAALCVATVALLGACSTDPAVADPDTTVAPDTVAPVDGAQDAADAADTAVPQDTEVPPVDSLEDTASLVDSGPEDTAVAVDTHSPDTDAPPNGFPGAELAIRIIEPGGNGTAPSVGSIVRLAGVLFGEADSITWTCSSCTPGSGAAPLGPFWQSGPMELRTGDNVIVVTASRGGRFVSDEIVVTYNPAFRFDDALVARPQVLWVNQKTDLVFTIPSSLYGNANTATLRLVRVDANGNVTGDVGPMKDDGGLNTSGDEIEADAVFTLSKEFTCLTPEPMFFRAIVDIAGGQSYTAASPTVRVDCIAHVATADCNAHKAVIDTAAASLGGGAPAEEVLGALQADATVKAAGRASGNGTSLWVQFKDGVLGAVLATPSGKRGGGPDGFGHAAPSTGGVPSPLALSGLTTFDIGSKRAIVLAPFSQEFGSTDDGVDVANAIQSNACPTYELEGGTVLQGANASLARFRDLATYGVASISSHGEALFAGVVAEDMKALYQWRHVGAQEVLWTGSPVACGQLVQALEACTVDSTDPTGGCPAGTRCLVTEGTASPGEASGSGICLDETQIDLRLGRVILTNKGYAVTPSFFTAYRGRGYPRSLVNLGACRTMYNGSLASALYAAGARVITGFSGYVESAFARDKVVELFEDFGSGGTIGQHYLVDEDPDNEGTFWRFFGATNLNVSNAEIINGDFETGDTVGWTAYGDGRVVTQLGSSTPVAGKFVGLVSTGLGFTVETGTLEQRFCIPADKVQIELYWKVFSEEFKEFCGSQYQDTFQAVLVSDEGQLTLVDTRVDDLCGYEDGSCDTCTSPVPCDPECSGQVGCYLPDGGGACTGVYNCNCGKYFVGLTPSDISFDQGGVFNILWQRSVKNIQALAGAGPVTLRLFAGDVGDSVFDTAILLDAIKFK